MLSEVSQRTQHRKRAQRYNVPGHAHELTFSTYRRRPILLHDDRSRIVCGAIRRACRRLQFDVLAFVLMPEHLHLIVRPDGKGCDVSALLYAIKRPSSHHIKVTLRHSDDPLLEQLTVRERPGKFCFRFWQEGGGYDRNLRTREAARHAVGYVHRNPVRRGLCASESKWAWSSCRQYVEPGCDVPQWMPRVRRVW